MQKVRWDRVFLAMIACVVCPEFARGGVLAPGTPVAGVSQAVWGDRWWQWAMSYPEGSNPLTDPTGAFSGLGDQGPVFFLAGTVSGPAVRVATVREGQTLLLPIVMVTAPIGLFGSNEAEVRADATATMGTASNLFLTIDGSPASLPASAPSLLDYYQTTPPGTFPLTFVDNNIYGVDPGTYNSVAVGYLVMLEGLSVGTHTLRFGGSFSGTPSLGYDPFDTNLTYTITVVPVPEPSSIALAGLAGLVIAAGHGYRRRLAPQAAVGLASCERRLAG